MKVLIAEDDRVTAKILERHLNNWGYEVFLEKNGEDAWQTLEKENIQIALLDWMMPKLNGIQLCHKIRKKRSDLYTYVILLTARASTEDIVLGLNSGADDYVTKPVEYLELQARLKTGIRLIELENKNKRLQKRLEKLAKQDSLTGFWNKKTIENLLEQELSRGRRDHRPVSSILIDIDKFKTINDTYGHHIGDAVLMEIASRLDKVTRGHDQIGRYGGDEFLVVLWNTGFSHLEVIAKRLCTAISKDKIQTEIGPLDTSISVGGTSSKFQPDISMEDMIKLSDQALYAAKRKGRNIAEIIKTQKEDKDNEYVQSP